MNFSEWQQISHAAQLGNVEDARALKTEENHSSWQLITDKGVYFVKTTFKRHAPFLTAQAHNLAAIAQTQTLRCANVVAQGQTTKTAWLAIEWLSLHNTGNQHMLGKQLAALHRHTGKAFGWKETNFIEKSIQHNHQLDDWTAFYRAQRLLPQLRRAAEHGLAQATVIDIEHLLERVDDFFVDYQPVPSLLHGNLSITNIGFLDDGTPVVFNAACSYGDREMDIAMSELSADFSADFYSAYQAEYPLNQGYGQRKVLYQLYALLNAFNQLGGSYAQQIKMLLTLKKTHSL